MKALFSAWGLLLAVGLLFGPPAWGQDGGPERHEADALAAAASDVSTLGSPQAVRVASLGEARLEKSRRQQLSAARVPSVEDVPALGRAVTVRLRGVTLEQALHRIAAEAGLRIAYLRETAAASGDVTLEVSAVSAQAALQVVLRGTELRLVQAGGGQLVLVPRPAPMRLQPAALVPARVSMQAGTIEGTVTDDGTGEPIPGVNVVIEGTQQGASTGPDGAYVITGVAAGTYTVQASFVGYSEEIEEGVTVEDGQTTTVDFAMQQAQLGLDEVIVVGYGSQKKENLTGSVASISSQEIEGIPAANTASLLQGKMSGVTVSNFASQPGQDNPQITIRGAGTFNAGQNPLIVIDGATSSMSTFSQISPSDVESVTVLKDAASAAIYGSRAANGVILVETRQGTRQAPEITFRSTFTRQTPVVDVDLLGSSDYARTVNAWEMAEGGTPLYTDEMLQKIDEGSAPDEFADTDWFSEFINPATMQEYYLSVAGGAENTRYMVSSSYKNQPGIMEGTSAEQFNVRSNLNVDVGDKADVGLNLFGYKERTNEPASGSASGGGDQSLLYIVRRFAKPTVPVKYSNGEWGTVDGLYPEWGQPIRNPLELAQQGEQYEDRYHLDVNLTGALNLSRHLTLKSRVAGVYNSSVFTSFHPTTTSYDASGDILSESPINDLTNTSDTDYRVLNENTVAYDPAFGKHNLSLLGGQSIEYYRYDYFRGYAERFPNNNIRELSAGVENLSVDGWATTYGLFSLFGRASYNYDSRYLFEANLRYDGSSRLPENERFGLFPSFSAGWVLSDEAFMQDVDFLSFLKLRASWGQLGNQQIGNYPYSQTYATGQDYIIGGDLQGGVAITSLANPNISWEATTTTDVGLDFYLFQDRLQVTADYFNKSTTDLLLRLPIPANQGSVQAPYQNVGEVRNRGWELSASYSHAFSSNLSFDAGFNVSRIRNEIVDLGELGSNEDGGWIGGDRAYFEGAPIGAYYGYVAQGYFQSEEEIENHAEQFGELAPGDVKFKDLNGDGVIDPDNDRQIIGTPFPDYTFGFNLGARYRGFDVRTFLQGIQGIERFNWYNNELTARSNFTESIKDRWSEDNRDAQFPRFGNTANNNEHSSYWLQNASYLRLKHLELGYTLPTTLTQQLSIRSMRVYVAGYNLLTFSPMDEFDPERFSGDNRNQGYPGLKNYALGVNLRF